MRRYIQKPIPANAIAAMGPMTAPAIQALLDEEPPPDDVVVAAATGLLAVDGPTVTVAGPSEDVLAVVVVTTVLAGLSR